MNGADDVLHLGGTIQAIDIDPAVLWLFGFGIEQIEF
jgi:hypothetical protein